MAVSDKMVKSGCDAFNDLLTEDDYACPIQAIINAGWTDFDPDDESTWPKTNNDNWLVEQKNRCIDYVEWDDDYAPEEWENVIRYADLEHFRYEGE